MLQCTYVPVCWYLRVTFSPVSCSGAAKNKKRKEKERKKEEEERKKEKM